MRHEFNYFKNFPQVLEYADDTEYVQSCKVGQLRKKESLP